MTGKETDIDNHYIPRVHFPNTIWRYLLCHSISYQEIRQNWGRFSKALFTLMYSTLRFLPFLGPLKWGGGMFSAIQKSNLRQAMTISTETQTSRGKPIKRDILHAAQPPLDWEWRIVDTSFFSAPLDCLSAAQPRLKCVSQSTEYRDHSQPNTYTSSLSQYV